MTRPMNRMDETAVKRSLLTAFLMAAVVFLSFYAVRSQQPGLMVLVPLVPVAIWLLGNPSILLLTMMLVDKSKLTPPIPGDLTVSHLLQLMVIGWWVIYSALKKDRASKMDPAGRFLMAFFLNMLLITSVRGFGMSFLGSSTFGGSAYIYLSVSLIFYFAASRISLNEQHLKVLFFGGIIASILPFFAQLSIYLTGGTSSFLANYFDISISAMAGAVMQMEGAYMRWSELRNLSAALLIFALVLPWFRRRKILSWGLVGIAFCLAMLTGFRSRLAGMAILVFMWLIYDSDNRKQTFFTLLVLGLVGWGAALILMPFFPSAMQRTLSFLPLAEGRITDPMVVMSAKSSTDFRLEVWRIAWANASKYLLLGRGLTLETESWAWLSARWYGTPEFYYDAHRYHSGPLGLLVDTGLPGLFSVVGFMSSVCVKGWQGVRRFCAKRKDLISRFYAFLVVQFTYSVFEYFFVFGDIRQTIPELVLKAVLIGIFYKELAERSTRNPVEMSSDIVLAADADDERGLGWKK